MNKFALSLTLLLALALPAWAGAPATREVRVYFADGEQLAARLGPLLGRLDVFTEGQSVDGRRYLVVAVSPEQLKAVQATGLATEVTWASLTDKYQAITRGAAQLKRYTADGPLSSDFGYFFNYYEMQDTIRHIAANYPQLVRIDSSMRTYEGRAMYCLRISDNPGSTENEPQVFINAVTHAREPMGCHASVTFASLLCRDYGHDSLVTWLVNNREIYIMPVLNADGYVYNSDVSPSYPYWRKNTNFTPPRTSGVDLNRNYGYRWGLDDNGSSPYPDDETYRGPSRFSEPEPQVVRDFEAARKFRTCMDFHTYGQYNLYAWGHTNADPPEYSTILYPMGETLKANNGYWQTGPTYRTIYPTNGNSVDWEQADTLLNGNRKFITYAFSSELGVNDFWYGENDPGYVDNEVAINIPNLYFLTRIAGVWFEPAGMVVNDTATGNHTGQLDPGETANLWFKIKNRAVHPIDTAKTVTAVLRSSDTMVQVVTPFVNFPNIARQTTAHNGASQFQVQVNRNAAPGTNVNLRLEVTFSDDNVTIVQPVSFRTTIGNNSALSEDLAPRPSSLAPIFSASPTPTRGSVQFGVLQSVICNLQSSIRIHDATGRLVQVLSIPRTADHNPQYVSWDRTDLHGRSVAPGIYFARLGPERSGRCSGIVLLP